MFLSFFTIAIFADISILYYVEDKIAHDIDCVYIFVAMLYIYIICSQLPEVTHKVYLDIGEFYKFLIIIYHISDVYTPALCGRTIPSLYDMNNMKHNTQKTVIEEEEEEPIKGRITLGLFGKVAPKATENFRSLCACDKGNGKISGKPLCYEGSTFHRISELVLWVDFLFNYYILCPGVSQYLSYNVSHCLYYVHI